MNIVIPKPVNEVLNVINDNGYEAYIIGGAVRNWVMETKPSNYDISTNGNLEAIQKALKEYNTYYCGENNSRLGIVNAKFPMEISKYRTEENTLEADLASRDFTMNALAYSDEDGLIDYGTGVVDIKNKVIRINGEDDHIFVEDPLRIIRAIRLSAEYGMRIDPETQNYMNNNKDLITYVAPERLRDELSKILVIPRAEFYIKKYFDIFLKFIPELALIENYNQNDPHHIYDALEHTFVALKTVETNLELRLATLFHDIGKPFTASKTSDGKTIYKDHAKKSAEMAREILNRLKYNKKTINKVVKLIEYHDYQVPENFTLVMQFLKKFGAEDIDDLYKLKRANYYAKNPAYTTEINYINNDYERLKHLTKKDTFIKRNEMNVEGKDLIELGFKQESIGMILDQIYQDILNGKIKNKHEKIIKYIEEKGLNNQLV